MLSTSNRFLSSCESLKFTLFGTLAPLSTNHREKSSIGGTQETLPNKDPNEYKDCFKRALTNIW